MMNSNKIVLYGAYGYTGELILEEAIQKGYRPLVAGRNPGKVKRLARKYDLEYAVFSIEQHQQLKEVLAKALLIINCAGPFIHTAKKIVEACISSGTHYIDITGEWQVFEWIHSKNKDAEEANVMLMPGTGFDVVPSDCLAAYTKENLPSAKFLEIGFMGGSGMSKGTAITMVENLDAPGMVRRDGVLEEIENGQEVRKKMVLGKEKFFASVPWGDISTAWYSTGIPNIKVFTGVSPNKLKVLRIINRQKWLLRKYIVQTMLKRYIRRKIKGPDQLTRKTEFSHLWSYALSEEGAIFEAELRTPEAYQLTAITTVLIMEKVILGNWKSGYQTPATAYGADLIMEVPGVQRSIVSN